MMNARKANEILATLDDEQYRRALLECGSMELVQGETLSEAGDEIEHIYFPTEGVISILATYATGDLIEVATVGREGFVGITAILDGLVNPGTHTVQMPGHAYVLRRDKFDRLVSEEPAFRALVKRYTDVFIYQIMISAACNGAHTVEERLARWLLMMLDRSDAAAVTLTHEFLADILSVRRATITDALRRLEASGAIERGRGRVEVRERSMLTTASCECYGMVLNYRKKNILRHAS